MLILTMISGNTYSDCSNQISTAVLACDILRYSLIRLCKFFVISKLKENISFPNLNLGNFLQPFVSPVNIDCEDNEIEVLALFPENNIKPKNDIKIRRKRHYRCHNPVSNIRK